MQPNQNDPAPQAPPQNDSGVPSNSRDAAAKLMRSQIDRIYDEHDPQAPKTATYHQTHSEQADHEAASRADAHWKQYHTAWQSYYQQYYERYYVSQIQKRQSNVSGHVAIEATQPQQVAATTPITRDQAVDELRDKLIAQVKDSSKSVRKSRHFMPIVAALVVGLTFALLQYNRLIVAQVKAYVSPGSISAENIVIDPTIDTKVNPAPKIIIPKINVDAPVVYDVPSIDEPVVQEKLKSGVVHYPIPGASSLPGQKGNTVVLGHSSNDVFDDGAYKFVFVQLDKLEIGDTFYLNYNSTRYTYSVTEKKVILPTEVSSLVIDTDKPIATLVTCTPVGTALKRLVIMAEQISPDPSSKPASPIAGNSPTFFERLFGGNW
jgi:sortase A